MPSTSARTSSLAEAELTLSGVLSVSTLDASTHIPLTSALQLSLEVVRMVAEAHDRGEIVGVLDAAHLICRKNGALSFANTGGNPVAPELKRGDMPDRLTDVYALGALIYRLLTGHRVVPSKLVVPPSHSNPAVDTALDELVLQSLDEDPSERPYSARELERRMIEVFEELGLEPDSKTEATSLISKTVSQKKPARLVAAPAAPKPAAPKAVVARPAPKPRAIQAETVMEEDDWTPPASSGIEKKWLIIAGASIAALLLMFVAWPSKKHSSHANASDKVTAKADPTPAAPPAPKVEAHLVDPAPAPTLSQGASELQSQTKVTKMVVKPTVKTTVRKTTRRGRR